MNLITLKEIYQSLFHDRLTFILQGSFSDAMTENIIELSEYSISGNEDLKKMRKKISFLIAESFQNIVRHGLPSEDFVANSQKAGMFLTKSMSDRNYITTANTITPEQIIQLKPMLDRINELDPGELKDLYHNILSHGTLSQKGGAGLGLIEMARKSGKKLEYDFVPIDKEHSLFYLMITMLINDLPGHTFTLQMAEGFHKRVNSGNVFILYKGDFSKDSILPILNLAEENIAKNQEMPVTRKKVLTILIELLQNISLHGYARNNGTKDGILTMGAENGKYVICTGNLIEKNKADDLNQLLKKYSALDRNEINTTYKLLLRTGKASAMGGGGLGLIEIIKESTIKPEFSIEPFDENSFLFLLKSTV